MLVQLAPHLNELTINSGGKYFSIKKGQQMQVEHSIAMRLLKEGQVINAAYPEILNGEIVIVEHRDETGWRPIGNVTTRKKK